MDLFSVAQAIFGEQAKSQGAQAAPMGQKSGMLLSDPAKPFSVNPQGGGQPNPSGVQGPGQEAGNILGGLQQGTQNAIEYGTQGVPPSLQNQLDRATTAEQMAANTPIPEFGQFYQPGTYDSGVLPPRDAGPGVAAFDPQMVQQQMVSQSAPQMSNQMATNPMPQAQQQQQQQQQGFGSLFNLQGTPENPNLFLRLAEGYNRGGLVGSIGSALTRY